MPVCRNPSGFRRSGSHQRGGGGGRRLALQFAPSAMSGAVCKTPCCTAPTGEKAWPVYTSARLTPRPPDHVYYTTRNFKGRSVRARRNRWNPEGKQRSRKHPFLSPPRLESNAVFPANSQLVVATMASPKPCPLPPCAQRSAQTKPS